MPFFRRSARAKLRNAFRHSRGALSDDFGDRVVAFGHPRCSSGAGCGFHLHFYCNASTLVIDIKILREQF